MIAHRGASGYRPEHTLAAYALGARMGADYIEPDLVSTKDGVLVARHENEISGTTDVADHPEFAGRRTTKVDRRRLVHRLVHRGLHARRAARRCAPRSGSRSCGRATRSTTAATRCPTFQEVIDLSRRLSKELGRPIGIYPETKHPTYFRSIGLALEKPLVRTLRRNDLDGRKAKVFVQSFEVSNLKALDRKIDAPLVQLLSGRGSRPYDFVVAGDPRTYGDLATPAGLREISRYADGVGPSKDYIVPRDAAGRSLAPTDASWPTRTARAWWCIRTRSATRTRSCRSSCARRPTRPRTANAFAEYDQFYGLGVDGLFSDNPDTAVEARDD